MKRKYFYKMIICCLCLTLVLVLSGCQNTTTQNDILTQKATASGKTQITILVKYAFSINTFEKAIEEKFPNIDIVQVGNYTSDRGIDEYAARMEHDDLTDIVMTWPLDVGSEYWEDRLIDLSGMSFTSNYNTSMLNQISQDGKLYYLPGPSQIRGIVYNKTLFKEKGWSVPTDYDSFIKLCQTIEASGMRSLQLGFKNSEVFDTAFDGYGYSSSFSSLQDAQWLNSYNEGTGSFGDQYGNAIDTFQEMTAAGIFKTSDLDVDYSDREVMLFNRGCAMIEDSVLLARMGYDYNGCTDEFGLMPFFNKGDNADWARLYMVCYIGLNKHLTESANKEKYDLVKQIMEYISTTDGQKALAGDTGGMFSSLKGTSLPEVNELSDLVSTLEAGRFAIFPELKNAQTALREGLAGLLKGTLTKEQLIAQVDAANKSGVAAKEEEAIGTANKDFTLIDTGSYICDVLTKKSGSEIALYLDNGKDGLYNGKGVSGRFYNGDITMKDINRISPDLKSGDAGVLWNVTITGKNLINTLEKSIIIENSKKGWFYYFSGLKVEFNPTAEMGHRIKKITLSDGTAIEDDKKYTVAISNDSIPEEYMISCEKTNLKIKDILVEAIKEDKTISPSNDGRFTIVQ